MSSAKDDVRKPQRIVEGLLSTHAVVKQKFREAIHKAFPTLPEEACEAVVSTSNPKFGDYQCNNAMSLLKKHKDIVQCKSPKEIADKIEAELDRSCFSEVIIAPAGFVTVRFSSEWLQGQAQRIVSEGASCKVAEPLSVGVDYSSPNIAKEMHVGHLRSTIHGEALCRILEFVGHTVTRINHLGDWGTQFGMLIQYMFEEHPDFQTNPPPLSDLNTFYKKSKQRFDSDEEFKDKARKMVVKLQSGDAQARAAWKLIVDISLVEFQKIYDRLGVCLEDRGESFYNDMLPEVIGMIREKGFLVESDGAMCMWTETDPVKREKEVPLMAVKRDGGYGYDSTDLAGIYHRLIIVKHNWLIYITDVGQENHIVKIFEAAKMMGWHTPPETRCDHVGLGLVCGDDGKKFKTRSGDVVKLADLLDEAAERAANEIRARRSESEEGADDYLPIEEASKRLGFAAVKYFDLKQVRTNNYKFSYESMLDPKGNTAVYLLYAYARICAIFRKAKVEPETLDASKLHIGHPSERALCMSLLKFSEILELILGDMSCHRMCDYIYELCLSFTDFYRECRVVGSEEQESRLLLCEAVKRMLTIAFRLLGIETLPKI